MKKTILLRIYADDLHSNSWPIKGWECIPQYFSRHPKIGPARYYKNGRFDYCWNKVCLTDFEVKRYQNENN